MHLLNFLVEIILKNIFSILYNSRKNLQEKVRALLLIKLLPLIERDFPLVTVRTTGRALLYKI